MRILILNNYSFFRVANEIENGLKPKHHLYGAIELQENNYELIIIEPNESGFWKKIGKLSSKIPFSYFDYIYIQIQAYKLRHTYDLVYAPCQNMTHLLGFLSFFGLYNKRIIALAHHPLLGGKFSFLRKMGYYLTLKGHYKWATLSTKVAQEINLIANTNLAECFHWGPELEYYDSVVSKHIISNKHVDILAIGRTGRDYQVLIDAFNNTNIKVEIYCSNEFVNQLSSKHSKNIRIIALSNEEGLNYIELIALYNTAKILAIPLYAQNFLAGLTSLTDAIALGIPVIMTKNDFIEIDIEKDNIGCWVDAGDSQQWRKCAEKMLTEDYLNIAKSNLINIVQPKYNSNRYFDELMNVIATI